MEDFQVSPISPLGMQSPVQSNTIPVPSLPSKFFRPRTAYIVAGALLLLLVVFGAFWMMRAGSFIESGVAMSIDAPQEITAGDAVTYKVSYTNNTQVALQQAKLTFFYPNGAISADGTQTIGVPSIAFDIGSLNPGQTGEQEIGVFLVGDQGEVKTARAVLTFTPSGITTTIQHEATVSTTVAKLAVPLMLIAPSTVSMGQAISYSIDYKNTTDQDVTNLRFKLSYPDGFKFTKATPGSSVGNATWDVPLLKAGDGARITADGSIQGFQGETKKISLVVQKQVGSDANQYMDFEKTDASSVIAKPLLPIKITINDSPDYVAHLGDTLSYKLMYQNDSGVDINSLVMTMKLDGDMLDFSSINQADSTGFFDSRTNTVTWNASSAPEFGLLRANQSGSISFRIRLKGSFSGGIGIANSLVKASARLTAENIPVGVDVTQLFGQQDVITRITTAPVFKQTVAIGDSQFGMMGPFPPKVDQKTAFTIDWGIVNPSNDLVSSKIVGTLAPGASWQAMVRSNQASQSGPRFDPRSRSITWDIGLIPAGSGVTTSPFDGFFRLSITPSKTDIGTTPWLLKDVHFEGIDSVTKEKIIQSVRDITTQVVNDSTLTGSVQQ